MGTVKLPDHDIPLSMTAPLPSLGMPTVSWPWKLSKTLQDWSAAQYHYPLGTVIQDVIDGHPVIAQIQVHDTYGAHPEIGVRLHKGTSVRVPATQDDSGKLVALSDPPPGWPGTSDIAGEFGGFAVHINLKNIVKGKPIVDIQSNFLHNAVKTAGRDIGSASGTLDKVTGAITNDIRKIPVAGPLLHGVLDVDSAPFRMVEQIGRGERVDRATLDGLKRAGEGAREVAPYAQTIISLVPGIGAPVSAAIGAAGALVAGRPLDDVMVAAVAGAIPGGAFATAGYNVGKAAMQHKPAVAVLAAGVTGGVKGIASISGEFGVEAPGADTKLANAVIMQGLKLARQLGSGQPLDQNAIQAAIDMLPDASMKAAVKSAQTLASKDSVPDVLIQSGIELMGNLSSTEKEQLANALAIGMAVGHTQRLQTLTKTALQSPVTIANLAAQAAVPISRDTTIQAARAMVKDGVHGFDQATGLLQNAITPFQFQTARNLLNGVDKKGFDLATALHIGRVAGSPDVPINLPARLKAAYHITHGMMGAPADNKRDLMALLTGSPLGKAGALTAMKEIGHARDSWWARLFAWLKRIF